MYTLLYSWITRQRPARPSRALRRTIAPLPHLPNELWDAILNNLEDQADLLRAAAVSVLFNDLSLRICFQRVDSGHEAIFSSETVTISSSALPLIHLSFQPRELQDLQQMSCAFGPGNGQYFRGFHYIREIISRSPLLRDLRLSFSSDVFEDGVPLERCLPVLCSALSLLTRRVTGLVYILHHGHVFSCHPQDLERWNLHRFEFISQNSKSPGPVSKPKPWSNTKFRLHTGQTVNVNPLVELKSVDIELSARFSMLIFNAHQLTHISLGSMWSQKSNKALSPDVLNTVIRQVSLPALGTIGIYTDGIDPEALRIFLARHPMLKTIEHRPHVGSKRQHSLLNGPFKHPCLTQISFAIPLTGSTRSLIADLAESPLETIELEIPTTLSPASLSKLSMELRGLAERCRSRLTLKFTLRGYHGPLEDYSFGGDKALEPVSKMLHCVRQVEVSCFAFEHARQVLLWLPLLPALESASFVLMLGCIMTSGDMRNVEELASQARSVLPGVSVTVLHGGG